MIFADKNSKLDTPILSVSVSRMAAKESILKFVVFLGTVRENNYGSRAARFMVRKLSEKGYQVTLLGQCTLFCSTALVAQISETSAAPRSTYFVLYVISKASAFVVCTDLKVWMKDRLNLSLRFFKSISQFLVKITLSLSAMCNELRQ